LNGELITPTSLQIDTVEHLACLRDVSILIIDHVTGSRKYQEMPGRSQATATESHRSTGV